MVSRMMLIPLLVIVLGVVCTAMPWQTQSSILAEDRLFSLADMDTTSLPRLSPHRDLAATAHGATDDELITKIRQLVNATMTQFGVNGLGLAVVKNGVSFMSEGFGLADIAHQLPATSQTLYQIGSTSKSFTSLVCLGVQEDGLMSLDRPLRDYYPAWRMNEDAMSETITTRDALSHRTGMARHDALWMLNDDTSDGYLRRLRFLDADKPLRYRTEYSNFGFLAAGQTCAAAEKTTWASQVHNRILSKLGMNHTYPLWREIPESQFINLAQPYAGPSTPTTIMPRNIIDEFGPAGSIISNVDDLQLWTMAWLKQLKGQTPLVGTNAFTQFIQANMPMPQWNPISGSYTLGNWLEQLHDTNTGRPLWTLHHGGGINGMSSQIGVVYTNDIINDGGAGIVILTNQGGSPAPAALFLAITDLLYPKPTAMGAHTDWNRVFGDLHSQHEATLRATHERHRYQATVAATVAPPAFEPFQLVGAYSHAAYGPFHIDIQSEKLVAKCGLGGYFPLVPVGGATYVFYFNWTVTAELPITFVANEVNDVTSFYATLDAAVPPIYFTNKNYTTRGIGYQWPVTCHAPTPPTPPSPPPIVINTTSTNVIVPDNVTVTTGDMITLIIATSISGAVIAVLLIACMNRACKKSAPALDGDAMLLHT